MRQSMEEADAGRREAILPKKVAGGSSELRLLAAMLRWLCVDQTSAWRTSLSWSVFALLAVGVPVASHFLLDCPDCDADHSRPYHVPAQIALTLYAAISFICLTRWSRKHTLRRFLFIDRVADASDKVRFGYEQKLQKSMKFLVIITLLYFSAESAYKIWWYITGADELPHYGNIYACFSIFCALELTSWLYRTTMIFLVCILFQILCYLQILRLEEYARVFSKETEVCPILMEHLKIRKNLRTISHRFRLFILLSLILVTVSQLVALLMTTRATAHVDVSKAGELALCCISIVTGLFICLRSATKVTHRAQSITGLAAKWHISATINSFDYTDGETPTAPATSDQVFPTLPGSESDDEESGDLEDDFNETKWVPIFASTISFQKRQALVTYLENNRAGITVYGFMLDRTWIHSIFGIQLALLLWLLNKTVGIS